MKKAKIMPTTKYDFTPAGVQQKLNDLYALTDPELAIEAAAVKSDLRLWMNNNFNLNTDQQNYLTNLDDRAVDYIGDEASFFFTYRLSIVLIQDQPTGDSDQLKWVHTENTAKIAANDEGDFTAEGTFTIEIVYE